MARAHSLADQAEHRELAVLVDGPWRPAWLWRDDLEASIASARAMAAVEHHRCELRDYQPTDEWVEHPNGDGVQGRAWRYREPEPAPL